MPYYSSYSGGEVDEAVALAHSHDNIDELDKVNSGDVGKWNGYSTSKADVTSVYTKTEVDGLVSPKADASSVYTKTEVSALLLGKVDTSSVYTKIEVDDKLDDKADATNVYTKTEVDDLLDDKADVTNVYTKTEVDDTFATKGYGYSKAESDAKYLTEHQDISGKQDKLTAGANISIVGNVISADCVKSTDHSVVNMLVVPELPADPDPTTLYIVIE